MAELGASQRTDLTVDEKKKALIDRVKGLEVSSFDLTSEQDENYNCIAWAAGDIENWWWPIGGHWPDGIEEQETLAAFEAAYGTRGYAVCETPELEEGFEKVAIYELRGVPTHAARQLPDGNWTSKLGALEDVRHPIEGLKVEIYGNPVRYLKRPRPAKQ